MSKHNKGNESKNNRLLSTNTRQKKAKQYFLHIKKYNNKLKELGFHLSDRYSAICLFDGDNENPIDSL